MLRFPVADYKDHHMDWMHVGRGGSAMSLLRFVILLLGLTANNSFQH